MGSDFIYSYVPKCEITPERKARLLTLADNLTEDSPEIDSLRNECDPAGSLEELREEVRGAIGLLADEPLGLRSVVDLDLPGADYAILFTGGLSWGDDPTDSYRPLSTIAATVAIWAQLEEWAKAEKLLNRVEPTAATG